MLTVGNLIQLNYRCKRLDQIYDVVDPKFGFPATFLREVEQVGFKAKDSSNCALLLSKKKKKSPKVQKARDGADK